MTGHVLSVAAGVTGRASPIAPVPVEEGFNTDQELAPTHYQRTEEGIVLDQRWDIGKFVTHSRVQLAPKHFDNSSVRLSTPNTTLFILQITVRWYVERNLMLFLNDETSKMGRDASVIPQSRTSAFRESADAYPVVMNWILR